MTDWEDQNAKQWRKISFALQAQARGGVFWITCDQFQHRQRILHDFQERFPDYDHTIGKVDRFPGGSLPQYMRDVFVALGGKPDAERPQMFHVSGLERYLSHTSDAGKGGFFEALNFERPLFYRGLPFVLVFWSDSHTLVQAHRLAGDFWEWLTHKYEFEAPADQLPEDARIGQDWVSRYWEELAPEEAELLHNRNARLLALLEEQTGDANRLSLWIGLADNFDKLRDFPNALRYRRLALAHLQGHDQGSYRRQLAALVLTISRSGNMLHLQGDLDGARKLYEEVLGLLPVDALLKERAEILKRLGDLERHLGKVDSARAQYQEAIGYFKAELENRGLANALKSLGDLESSLDNVVGARALYEEAISHYKTERNLLGTANALEGLGDLDRQLGNVDSARALYEEAISNFKTVGDFLGLANALQSLGDLERHLGNVDSARALFEEAIGHYKTERHNLGLANALVSLGHLDFHQGDLDSARALFEEAIGHYKAARSPRNLAITYTQMARLAHESGQPKARDAHYAQALLHAKACNLPPILKWVQSIGKAWNASS
jgi:tetratricopeptide (TPR) repeat protein